MTEDQEFPTVPADVVAVALDVIREGGDSSELLAPLMGGFPGFIERHGWSVTGAGYTTYALKIDGDRFVWHARVLDHIDEGLPPWLMGELATLARVQLEPEHRTLDPFADLVSDYYMGLAEVAAVINGSWIINDIKIGNRSQFSRVVPSRMMSSRRSRWSLAKRAGGSP